MHSKRNVFAIISRGGGGAPDKPKKGEGRPPPPGRRGAAGGAGEGGGWEERPPLKSSGCWPGAASRQGASTCESRPIARLPIATGSAMPIIPADRLKAIDEALLG